MHWIDETWAQLFLNFVRNEGTFARLELSIYRKTATNSLHVMAVFENSSKRNWYYLFIYPYSIYCTTQAISKYSKNSVREMSGCDEYNTLYHYLGDLWTCHSSLIQHLKWSSFTVFMYSACVFSSVSFVALSLRVYTNTMEFIMQYLWVHLSVLQCVVWHAPEMLLHEWSWSGWCFTAAEWFSCFHCTSFQIDI